MTAPTDDIARVVCLRTISGARHQLDVARWTAPAEPADLIAVEGIPGPVIDVGCGPGRIAAALAERRVPCLGIDVAPTALAAARARGASVLDRSVFDPVPGEGRWATALLFDGNVGIGGDPSALLSRVGRMVRPGGLIVVELGRPGLGLRQEDVTVDVPGAHERWFPWAWVGVDVLDQVIRPTGLVTEMCAPIDDRWFARLRRPPSTTHSGCSARDPTRHSQPGGTLGGVGSAS